MVGDSLRLGAGPLGSVVARCLDAVPAAVAALFDGTRALPPRLKSSLAGIIRSKVSAMERNLCTSVAECMHYMREGREARSEWQKASRAACVENVSRAFIDMLSSVVAARSHCVDLISPLVSSASAGGFNVISPEYLNVSSLFRFIFLLRSDFDFSADVWLQDLWHQ